MKNRQLKRITFLVMTLFWAYAAAAQTTVKGQLIDAATGEALVGVSISVQGSTRGTVSDLDGNFTIETTGNEILSFKYVGYKTVQKGIKTGQVDLKTIAMETDAFALDDVIITSSIATARQTPVALSTITPQIIEEKLGTQEFPEILKTTPGVYATKQGGGFGDSRINLRGFESANIAVMVNGVPMNDMEWGGVYWSNWAGLGDVTRLMQVQRGLGASKVSAPSVGGSINIVTKSTDAKKGGTVSYGLGNDGYNKLAFSVSTGLMDNGWAMTVLGSKTTGDGYIQGTEFEGYSYFFNIAKRIGSSQQLSLTAFGAPQWHNQRYNNDKLKIGDWEKMPGTYRFNPAYGYDTNGQRHTAYYNYYHKPQISLNHLWDINEKSNLSTAIYTSIGRGGGYAARGNSASDLYGSSSGVLNTKYRTPDGYYDFGALMATNAANPNGAQAIAATSTNEHNWYGLLSTYTNKAGDFDLSGGIDARYYEGIHQAYITDLMGGAFYIDNQYRNSVKASLNPDHNNTMVDWVNEKLYVGDQVYRDNTGYVVQGGVFAQAEYKKNNLTAFVSGSVNNNTYWKIDRFYYNNQKSETANFWGWTAKGGVNYNIDEHFNIFGNIGYISRVPFMSDGVFTNIHVSNGMNTNAVNEKVFSKELGAGYTSQYFTANLNLYHTNWNDRTTVRAIDTSNPDRGAINLQGVNSLHQGIELDFIARPIKNLEITGMFSLGDWTLKGQPKGYCYNRESQAVDQSGNVVEEFSADHAWAQLNVDGVHVGGLGSTTSSTNSAQTTGSLGASYKLFGGFKVGVDAIYYGRNYAGFKIEPVTNTEQTVAEPWCIPDVVLFDAHASYSFKLGGLDASVSGVVNNLFNTAYIADANDGASHNWDSALVMYGFGRTASVTFKVKF
ncbi:MAG: TonB-dependent receptor [Dysgonamonadaceae bacterium]|jgi:outer membrane cobalamin receptor|nr:TonB-dependent receptor [Dysgonamonadaceae bacterium]